MAMGKRWPLCCALLLLPSTAALAAPLSSGTRLSYNRVLPGAERCPDEQGFRDMVASQMGGADPFVAGGAQRVEVSLSRKGRAFLGTFSLVDGAGHTTKPRELSGPSCGAVAEDLAFSVSIALRASSSSPPPPPPPPAPAPAPASPPPPLADVSAAPLPEPPSIALRLGVGAAIGLGVSPARAAPGVALDVGLRWLRWAPLSLALEGRAYPRATGPADSGAARVTTGLYTGALVPCAHWSVVARLSLAGCALVELGALRVTSDAPHPVPSTFLHAAAGLRAGVEVPLIDHLALQATGDMLFTLRPSVALIYGARAWETPLVSASFGLGAVATF
jgi:hypothetical protein